MIAVGDSARLEVTFNTGTYSSHVIKRPSISSNGSDYALHVSITTDVTPATDSLRPLVIWPYKINLISIGDPPVQSAEFTIANLGDEIARPTLVATEPAWFTVTLPHFIAPGDSAIGVIHFTDEGLASKVEKSFTFELDDAGATRYTVPVVRTILPSSGTAPAAVTDCEE